MQLDGRAGLTGEPVHDDDVPDGDLLLTAASADDRVHVELALWSISLDHGARTARRAGPELGTASNRARHEEACHRHTEGQAYRQRSAGQGQNRPTRDQHSRACGRATAGSGALRRVAAPRGPAAVVAAVCRRPRRRRPRPPRSAAAHSGRVPPRRARSVAGRRPRADPPPAGAGAARLTAARRLGRASPPARRAGSTPRPPQCSQVSLNDLEQALPDPLAGHLHEPQRGHLGDLVLGAVPAQALQQAAQHEVAVALQHHVDEVDDDDAADVAQPELADDLLGGLEVVAW